MLRKYNNGNQIETFRNFISGDRYVIISITKRINNLHIYCTYTSIRQY